MTTAPPSEYGDRPIPPSLLRLDSRVSSLPFDVIPRAVNWSYVLRTTRKGGGNYDDDKNNIDEEMHHPPPNAAASALLLSAVLFAIERITSRNGDVSSERRGTAWVTEEGVGALAYSGKLMRPSPRPYVPS